MQQQRNWQSCENSNHRTVIQIPIIMKKIFLLFICIVLSHFMMMAQAPFISTNISNTNPQVGETITVDVLTTNFTNLIAIGFEIKWDPNIFEYVSTDNIISTAMLPGFTPASSIGNTPPNTNRGIIAVSWLDNNLAANNLPNQTRLLTVTLRAKANGSSKIEVVAGVYGIPDSNTEFRMQPDSKDVTVGSGTPVNNTPVSITIGNTTGRVGQEIRVPVTVSNFVNMELFNLAFDIILLCYNLCALMP